MKTYKVAVIQGDGIGPEVIQATVRLIEATGIKIDWEYVKIDPETMVNHPDELPANVIDSINNCEAVLKGPISTPVGGGFTSPSVLLRRQLKLYASVRPVKSIEPNFSLQPSTDIIVVREVTEDVYIMKEHMKSDNEAVAEKLITRDASEKIAHKAFSLARELGRSKVTALHKADILKLTDGLFLECCRSVAEQYPDIRFEEGTIDSACMELILDPTKFDVVVAPNMYGDIFSDVAAGLVGGLGLIGSATIGDGPTVYEAVHGSAPNIAGQGIANPSGVISASIMMLRDFDEVDIANKLQNALENTIKEGKVLTADLGGTDSTEQFVDRLIETYRIS